MPDYIDNEGMDELKKLESLIEESDADLKKLDAQIEDIEKQIKEKEIEIKAGEDARKAEAPKIFTRKQIKKLLEEREAAEERRLLELKNNIDIITKSEFEKARLIRAEAQDGSGEQKKSAEIRALETEISALEKEQEVKGAILREKQEKSQEALADKISKELKIEKFRKDLAKLQISKQDNGIIGRDLRSRMNAEVMNKNRFMHDYERLSREIDEIESRLKKSKNTLRSKLVEIETLKSL